MSYTERLAECFIHNPSEYVFVREYSQKTSCACGHPIHNCFEVQHPTGHMLVLGSECINNYPQLDHVRAAIEKKRAEEKARLEEIKKMEEDKEFGELKVVYDDLVEKCKHLRQQTGPSWIRGNRLRSTVYCNSFGGWIYKKKWTKKSTWIKNMKKEIANIETSLKTPYEDREY